MHETVNKHTFKNMPWDEMRLETWDELSCLSEGCGVMVEWVQFGGRSFESDLRGSVSENLLVVPTCVYVATTMFHPLSSMCNLASALLTPWHFGGKYQYLISNLVAKMLVKIHHKKMFSN